jgi:hypothetical protein
MDQLATRDQRQELGTRPEVLAEAVDLPSAGRFEGRRIGRHLPGEVVPTPDAVVGDVFQGDRIALRQWMVASHRKHARLAREHRADDEIGLGEWQANGEHLDVATAQRAERDRSATLRDPDVAAGVARLERLDDVHETWAPRGEVFADAQRAGDLPTRGGSLLEHATELAIGDAELLLETVAQRGEETRRLVRCRSGPPSFASSSRRLWLTRDWVSPSRSALRPK